MAWLQNGTVSTNSSGTNTNSVTVPSGVTSDQSCLFTLSGSSNGTVAGASTPSTSNGTATIETWFNSSSIGSSFISAYHARGLVAGDTFTVTTANNNITRMGHFYFSTPLVTPGTIGLRPGVQTTTDAPDTTEVSGSTVYVYFVSRSATTGSDFVSAVNANGRTVTDLFTYFIGSGTSGLNFYLGQFDEPTDQTNTTTITETVATDNSGAFHFAEAAGASVAWL